LKISDCRCISVLFAAPVKRVSVARKGYVCRGGSKEPPSVF
jgi:hypothetical protein